jgi:hypothetical protein
VKCAGKDSMEFFLIQICCVRWEIYLFFKYVCIYTYARLFCILWNRQIISSVPGWFYYQTKNIRIHKCKYKAGKLRHHNYTVLDGILKMLTIIILWKCKCSLSMNRSGICEFSCTVSPRYFILQLLQKLNKEK